MTPLLSIPLAGLPCAACHRPALRVDVYTGHRVVRHRGHRDCLIGNYRGPHARQGSGGRPYDPAAVRHNRRKGKAA